MANLRTLSGIGAYDRSPGEAFRLVERLTSVGQVIAVAEQLLYPSKLDDRGLFSWPVNRTGLRIYREDSRRARRA